MAKNKALFGIYRTQSGLENAVQMLRDERFSSSDVAVLLPESASSRELGTQKASKAPEGATAHWSGFQSGQFQQTFTLPAPINADRAEASTADGVLTLTLPKAEHAKARTLRVTAKKQ